MSARGSRYLFSVVRERLRRHDGPVLDFAFGRFRQPLPNRLHQLVRAEAETALVRATPAELESFCETAAAFLDRTYGVSVSARAILPTPGGRAALSSIAATWIEPNQRVLVTEPTYPVFNRVAAQRHARVVTVPLDPDHGFDPDPQAAVGDGDAAALVALNYPNNPTGVVPTASALDRWSELSDADTIWLNDAIYGPMTHDQSPYSLLAHVTDPERRVIELHSMTKIFELGPLSVAFLVGRESLVDPVREYCDFAWSPLSALQVQAGRACLEDAEHVEAVCEGNRVRLRRLTEVVEQLGFRPFPVHGGQYLLCRVPASVGGEAVDGPQAAAELLLEKFDLAVVPWEATPCGYLRFSALYPPEDLEALAELGGGNKLVG